MCKARLLGQWGITALVLMALTVQAATPLGTAWTYQGLIQQGGSPPNDTCDFAFSLWDDPLATDPGNQIGATLTFDGQGGNPPPISVANGLFTVELDFGAGAFNGDERWLEIAVACPSGGALTTLSPRQPLTAAPNALFALNADRLDGLDSTAFLQSVPVPLTLSGTSQSSHIIRGENASTANFSTGVFGQASAATGTTYGGRFHSASTSGCGVYATGGVLGVLGEAIATSGTTFGGYFENASTSGIGVYSLVSAGTGTTYGGWFESISTNGRAVFGNARASSGLAHGGWFQTASTSGNGVVGQATAGTGATFGVVGESLSVSGTGVFGKAVATTGPTVGLYGLSNSSSENAAGVYGRAAAATGITYGGRFDSDSTSGRAVSGYAGAASGPTYGVLGQSESTDGRGVAGFAYAVTGSNYGVYGLSNSPQGYGVFGLSNSSPFGGTGVLGRTNDTIGGYGVRGQNSSPFGWGVFADGRLGASGTKSFRIDHPDDPENKYLLHYSVESPEVLNAYSGKATLDGAGQAVVELPHYFAKINKDPRYTLAAVGAPMPNLHVAEEIDAAALSAGATAAPGEAAQVCSFRIAGGAPGKKVSWELKAVRHDKWVRQRAAPVEVDKQGPEKGTYQHPELYGQPAEKGMNYRPDDAHPEAER